MRRFALFAAAAAILSVGIVLPAMPRPAAIEWARLVITGIVIVWGPAGSTRTIASAGTAFVGTIDISSPPAANDADRQTCGDCTASP